MPSPERVIEFDPLEWQRGKHNSAEIEKTRYSSEEQLALLEQLEAQFNEAILQGHQEYSNQNKIYGIVGIALYGSWFHGTAHPKSDVDGCLLVNNSYQDDHDFGYRLETVGFSRPFETLSHINIDTGQGSAGFLHFGYRIITPFPKIDSKAKGIIERLLKEQPYESPEPWETEIAEYIRNKRNLQ
ncbi:MAG TPA: nucleotidyltransferase domain-containing protein [Patescibacteria group bacterium]|nr:nucleotidyltransferase domain-containing protein [Patescibacteria group bacterium]